MASFALPENPLLRVELSLGALSKTVAADGTSATGTASLLNLELGTIANVGPLPFPSVDIADVDIVPLSATAGAPTGGIQCGDGPGNPEPGSIAAPDITSPTSGATVTDSDAHDLGHRPAGRPGHRHRGWHRRLHRDRARERHLEL